MFYNQIPFNRELGLELVYLGPEHVDLKMEMKPKLVGNYMHGILHGGVISASLDVAGGITSVVGAFERTHGLPDDERIKILSKIGTIDLRVDYLRPGRGEWFKITGRILRTGNKVAVTRMNFSNEKDELQAVGTGTYICG
ncbi:MAG: thioesterase family protein [Acidobacteriota bacterium]|nr:thioesterase family protein [Acidobacteriota bacterium]